MDVDLVIDAATLPKLGSVIPCDAAISRRYYLIMPSLVPLS